MSSVGDVLDVTAGVRRIDEVPDMDHGMHRTWQRHLRDRVFGEALDRMRDSSG